MNTTLLILDIDGTLTDSAIFYGNDNIEIKAFSTKDGAILKSLSYLDITVIFLTGRESEAVTRRAADLGTIAIQGIADKATKLHELLAERGFDFDQTAYIGDDLNDYAAMRFCGFKACPSDAATEIKAIADYISTFAGGHGAVRDCCEELLRREGKYSEFLKLWGIQS